MNFSPRHGYGTRLIPFVLSPWLPTSYDENDWDTKPHPISTEATLIFVLLSRFTPSEGTGKNGSKITTICQVFSWHGVLIRESNLQNFIPSSMKRE